ncbi:hypothetical protein P0Y35_13230 [Kiritimatiellaeota bacterium B1221]|nr:hypothetical protein [Kiritimatiellaeota bacterium B1221]
MNDEFLQPISLDEPPPAPGKTKTGKKKPSGLWLVALLLIAGLMALWMLREPPVETVTVVPAATAIPAPTATPDPAQRLAAEAALEKVLELMRALRPAEPGRWAKEAWTQLESDISVADGFMADLKYREAAEQYTAVIPALEKLKDQLPALPESLMPQAFEAYAAGQKIDAVALVQIVLFLDPENEDAKDLLPRAENADVSFAHLKKAGNLLESSKWDLAYAELSRLKTIDDQFPGAEELGVKVEEILSAEAYKKWMSQALVALGNDDLISAEAWVKKALDLDPVNQAALDLHQQINDRMVQQKVLLLKREAEVFAHEEKWGEAHKKWLEMKALDSGAPWIEEGLAQSLKWKVISEKIRKGLADPGSDQTGAWVKEMQEREGWPAKLSAQADELTAGWQLAVSPVKVEIVSDYETQVEITKVGRWKPFARKELSLKPGRYTAKGWRYGYRDVRVPFEVKPGQKDLVVEVKCVEGI